MNEAETRAELIDPKLNITYTYSSNGKEIYQINMETGKKVVVEDWKP